MIAEAPSPIAAPLNTPSTAGPAASGCAISVIVPGLNEAESLPELAERIDEALGDRGLGEDYEIIFVDDGSTDNSWQVISGLSADNPRVRGLRLRSNFGKAMALTSGFSESRGQTVFMMDADLQDDPADLPIFLEQVRNGLDVVVGWKVDRQDPLSRRIASKIFNGTVGWFTGVALHDMNCGFKAYNRAVIETIPIYGDLFRFIPALAAAEGFKVCEVPVRHHARQHGRSRYGLERITRGFFDLLSVLFLTRYARRPMHLFGLLGLISGLIGIGLGFYLTVLWLQGHSIGSRPLLLLSVMLMVMGVQFASLGLIGEFLTHQTQKHRLEEKLPIRDRVG